MAARHVDQVRRQALNRSRVWGCVPAGAAALPHILGLAAPLQVPSSAGPAVSSRQHWVGAAVFPHPQVSARQGPGARRSGPQPPGSVVRRWPGQDPQPLPHETEPQDSTATELMIKEGASEEAGTVGFLQ